MFHSLPLSRTTPTLKKHWWLLSDTEVGVLPQITAQRHPPFLMKRQRGQGWEQRELGSNMLPRAAVCLGNSTKGEGKKRKRN